MIVVIVVVVVAVVLALGLHLVIPRPCTSYRLDGHHPPPPPTPFSIQKLPAHHLSLLLASRRSSTEALIRKSCHRGGCQNWKARCICFLAWRRTGCMIFTANGAAPSAGAWPTPSCLRARPGRLRSSTQQMCRNCKGPSAAEQVSIRYAVANLQMDSERASGRLA